MKNWGDEIVIVYFGVPVIFVYCDADSEAVKSGGDPSREWSELLMNGPGRTGGSFHRC